MSKNLTEIQKKLLEFIINRIEQGMPPTLAEIAEYFGFKNRSSAQQHIAALEKKGFIKRDEGNARGIRLSNPPSLFVKKEVIGEVAAGNPLVIYQDAIDVVELPSAARLPKDSFLLKVKGNSLKDAFIFDGDIVIVNPNKQPKDGQIVAAVLDDAAVVKRYFDDGNLVELRSENPEYKPIYVNKEKDKFRVVGVVVGMYRSMK